MTLLSRRFHQNFMKMFLKFFLFLRWRLFTKSILILKMMRASMFYLSFNRYLLYYFGDVFSFSLRLKSRLLHALKKTFSRLFLNNESVKIIMKKLEVTEITAAVISKYFAVRLRQRFQLREVLMPVLRHLTYAYFVKGFRIVCAGRFTKKEIALYDLRTYSSVPFGGANTRLDFSLSEVVLKYSICGIKVWLQRQYLSDSFFNVYGIGLNFINIPQTPIAFGQRVRVQEFESAKPLFARTVDDKFIENFVLHINNKKQNLRLVNKKKFRLKLRNFFVGLVFKCAPAMDFFFFSFKLFLPKKIAVKKKFIKRERFIKKGKFSKNFSRFISNKTKQGKFKKKLF